MYIHSFVFFLRRTCDKNQRKHRRWGSGNKKKNRAPTSSCVTPVGASTLYCTVLYYTPTRKDYSGVQNR